MSRKTMDEWPQLYNLGRAPATSWPTNDDTRAQDLIDGRLIDEPVVRAFRVPWAADAHLADGTEDFRDALWGINEGKRDVRNLNRS